jgi:putative ABC transport system permease protein
MIAHLALKMLLYRPSRMAFAALGIGTVFLLSASQLALLVGWCKTIPAVVSHADADVWVMAEQTRAFDYGSPIPRHRVYQIRNVCGVRWTEAMYVSFGAWRRSDGRTSSVALVGLDKECVGGPWRMVEGHTDCVHAPDSVIVDELFLDSLGIRGIGDEAEIFGKKAVVRGISRDVRTFTATPFVFTSLKSALQYDHNYRPDEVTYVLARVEEGSDPDQVAAAIQSQVAGVEALSAAAFCRRSVSYWMFETGLGLTVVLTASLGVLVCALITSQSLYTLTHDLLLNYATLLALGFSRTSCLTCVLVQGLAISTSGICLGSVAYFLLSVSSRRSPVPLEMTPEVYAWLVAVSVGCCLLGSFLSVRTVVRIDPVSVFRS